MPGDEARKSPVFVPKNTAGQARKDGDIACMIELRSLAEIGD